MENPDKKFHDDNQPAQSPSLRSPAEKGNQERAVPTNKPLPLNWKVYRMLITPSFAEEILETKNTMNRRIDLSHSHRLLGEILSGRWSLSPQPVIFATDGTLLDGQHRLRAIVNSDKPGDIMVVEGVDKSEFIRLDSVSKPRSNADVAYIKGISNPTEAANAANALHQYTIDTWTGRGKAISSARNVEIIKENPNLENWVAITKAMIPKVRPIISRTPAAVGMYLVSEAYPDIDSFPFLEGVVAGVMVAPGDPRYALREKLISERMRLRGGGGLRAQKQLNWFIRAWNAWASGEQMPQRVRGDGTKKVEPRVRAERRAA